MATIRTVLHPTDFSPGSAAALDYASGMAAGRDGRLIVLHVLDEGEPIVADGEVLPSSLDDLRAWARRQLDAIRTPNSGSRVERVLREGSTAQVIVEAAHDFEADLVVMGTHGRTGFRRLVLGSVAEEVVRTAPCPVLTVRPEAS